MLPTKSLGMSWQADCKDLHLPTDLLAIEHLFRHEPALARVMPGSFHGLSDLPVLIERYLGGRCHPNVGTTTKVDFPITAEISGFLKGIPEQEASRVIEDATNIFGNTGPNGSGLVVVAIALRARGLKGAASKIFSKIKRSDNVAIIWSSVGENLLNAGEYLKAEIALNNAAEFKLDGENELSLGLIRQMPWAFFLMRKK